MFLEFLDAARAKLFKHSWFLSERLVIIAICSSQMHLSEKVKIWKALKKMKPSPSDKSSKGTVGNGLQQLPYLTDATNLDDLVGPDSWTSLHKFGGLEFIDKHPKHWRDCPSYQKMCDLVQSMPVINNSAEHVLGLVSSSYYGMA